MNIFANLHTHTTHSDGVLTPSGIVAVAKSEGYKAIAITDHDVATGWDEFATTCRALRMDYLLGTEFSSPSKDLNKTFHIVGLGFDREHPDMKDYLKKRAESETDLTEQLFRRGIKEGIFSDITWEEVIDFNPGKEYYCNEDVFRLLCHKGMAVDSDWTRIFLSAFGSHALKCVLKYPFLDLSDIISLIKESGGIAIVAHPTGVLDKIPTLQKMGIEGLEVWHGLLGSDERKEALRIALEHGMYISGGSDHDGICGGTYSRFEDPHNNRHYFPELSLGTYEIFFNELKERNLNDNRDDFIKALLMEEVL